MNKLKMLLVLLVSVVSMGFASTASAAGPCFQYSVFDSFEGPSNGGWTLWNSSVNGTIVFGNDVNAINGVGDARMAFGWTESTASFLVVDKLLNVNSSSFRSATGRAGCSTVVPWPPVGNPVSCSVSVYIKPTKSSAGLVEIIDPTTYDILAQKTFSYVSSSLWMFTGSNTSGVCKAGVIARVEMDHPTMSNETMYIDGLLLTWNYN